MNDALAVLVVLVALAVSAGAGAPLTAAVLRLASRSADAGEPRAPRADGRPRSAQDEQDEDDEPTGGDGPTGPHARDVLRGGTWIGILERLAVTVCVLAGYPSGVAFVIAVKGLGRFPELREHPGVSERFVIGTFASLLWAATIGVGARALLV